jgi:hypothetical protein
MSVNKYDASTGELTNIASGQRTWVGTQAAYKSAKQAGTLPNNTIIAITDDEVDHNHYSTEETETGMYWIDGKPIYKKSCKYTGTIASGTYISIMTLSDYESVVSIVGTFKNANDGNVFPINYVFPNDGQIAQSGRVVLMSMGRVDFAALGFPMTDITVTIEYTKSTD